ncbi:hypothetical protein [Flavipsychrobacter stenotrophus]|uniref:hypothetical protein n=1 Tax=Flavipsychrobacter stenotrophus TaxID=2077091 RepID=UPI00105754E0|nr:hypothetical protein [Flavipsychrobacter stenotrophus]
MRYSLFRNNNGEWTYFTYTEINRNIGIGDAVNVIFEGEERQYIVAFRLRLSNNDSPLLLVEENINVAPRIVEDNAVDVGKISFAVKVRNWFNNLSSKKK